MFLYSVLLNLNFCCASSSCFHYSSWRRKIQSQLGNLPKIDLLSEAEFNLLMTNYPWKRGTEPRSMCPHPPVVSSSIFQKLCVFALCPARVTTQAILTRLLVPVRLCFLLGEHACPTSLSLPLSILALCVCSLQLLTLGCLFHSLSPLYNMFQRYFPDRNWQDVPRFLNVSICCGPTIRREVLFTLRQNLASTGWSYNIQLDALELTIRG